MTVAEKALAGGVPPMAHAQISGAEVPARDAASRYPRCDRPRSPRSRADSQSRSRTSESLPRAPPGETVQERLRQEKRGRPGEQTRYRKTEKTIFTLTIKVNHDKVAYDAATDGQFPIVAPCWRSASTSPSWSSAGGRSAYTTRRTSGTEL